MKQELKDKLKKSKLLSFSQADIDKQKKFKGRKKKKKGTSVTAKELNDTLSAILKIKP